MNRRNAATPIASCKKRRVSNVVKFPVKRARAIKPAIPVKATKHRDEEVLALRRLVRIANGDHGYVHLEASDVPNVIPIVTEHWMLTAIESRASAQRLRAKAARLRHGNAFPDAG